MDTPLNGKNTVNDLIARINDLTVSVDGVTTGAITGPASAVADKFVAFADASGKVLKQASNVSDFAYTLLDDANQGAMQTTLGIKSAGLLDATPNNTANQVVQRDSSGNFSANLISAAVRGQVSREFISGTAGLYHWHDVAGYINGGASVTGTMKITLPVGWTNTMMSIIVRGYNHVTPGGAYEYTLSGYNVASAWSKPQVLASGNVPTVLPIRFGFDGTKACILIGDTTTSWNYPRLAITDVITSYAGANTGWDAGWVIAPITDETGITVSGTAYPNTVVHATSLEVGKADGSSGFATIDFHGGGATRVDYDARIGVNLGTGVVGGGTMSIYSSYLNLKTTAFVSSTTPAVDTNNTQVATTAYVLGQGSTANPPMDGVAAPGTSLRFSKADHVHPSDTSKVDVSTVGVANGLATLDATGLVPTTQLPAYVDDVLEFANLAAFPTTGESGKIYVALNTNKTYRWSGSAYIYITSGAVDSVAGKTGVVTLVKGDVGLGSVDNTSDANKPVSTAQQTALDLKAPVASPTFTGTPLAPTATSGTSTTQVASTAFVQDAIGGYLALPLTGGVRVLTADEAANATINVNGALTSDVTIEIPVSVSRMYTVANNTTGAFALYVRSGPTGTTVPVTQAKRNVIYTNTAGAFDSLNDFDSIALTGAPTTPTAAVGTNTTQVASTAYVRANSVTKDSDTGSADLPAGTTAQRTASPAFGFIRANSSINSVEWWNGAIWTPLGGGTGGATGAGTGTAQDQIFNETDKIVTGNWTIGQGSMLSGCTITIASPAVITFTSHGFTAGQPVRFTTTGALPTGLSVNSQYFVLATGLTTNTFQVSLTSGGTAVITTGTQSGVHSVGKIKDALVTKILQVANGVSVTVPTGSSLVVVGAGGGTGSTELYVNTFNAQDISGDKNFTVAPKLNGFDLTSIGLNQNWVDAPRVASTVYTNGSRPILWSMSQNAATTLVITINGFVVWNVASGGSDSSNVSFLIPANATYSYTGAIQQSKELR